MELAIREADFSATVRLLAQTSPRGHPRAVVVRASSGEDRAETVRATDRLLRLARELNAIRPPDDRERISHAVANTREYFRANPEAELPAPGEDALFDMARTVPLVP